MTLKEKILGIVAVLTTMGFAIVGISDLTEDEGYFCDATMEARNCYTLSKVNADGIQTRCYLGAEEREATDRTYHNCKSGWNSVKGLEIQIDAPKKCPDVNVIAYTDNGKYFCDGIGVGANCQKEEDLLMPFG